MPTAVNMLNTRAPFPTTVSELLSKFYDVTGAPKLDLTPAEKKSREIAALRKEYEDDRSKYLNVFYEALDANREPRADTKVVAARDQMRKSEVAHDKVAPVSILDQYWQNQHLSRRPSRSDEA